MNVQQFLHKQWSKRGLWAWFFLPLSLFVCLLAQLKRQAYLRGIFKQTHLTVPVIVIGNLSVGGTGKTPLVTHIAQLLINKGYRPGIISRGYKGTASHWPQLVTTSSDPVQVGDEPVMLATLTRCPVVAGPNRVESAQRLITDHACDVILSDDGFQHLKLARDIDILVFYTMQSDGLGNGWCLPSGPLREPASAQKSADMLVFHGTHSKPDTSSAYSMTLVPGEIYALNDKTVADTDRLRQQPLHAVVGIGHPARFFDSLRNQGLTIIEHAFDDHHSFISDDLDFDDDYQIITTEKDAIKLMLFPGGTKIWVLPIQVKPGKHFDANLLKKLWNL